MNSVKRGPSLEIRQIRYFVAIYEAGSVTKASARLLVAQSALSQQLAHLEEELGVQLFTRTPQGVAPTAFGQVFYSHALEILQRLREAVESLRQLGHNPRGNVTLGMPETISITLGLPLLQSVKQRFPQIQLRLTEDLSENIKMWLREGRLDLAITFDDGAWEGLLAQPLVTERLYLVSREPLDSNNAVTLSRALKYPLVLPDVRDGLRNIIDRAARNAGLQISNVVSEVSSLTVIKNAVLQGLGATILPISCVSAEVQQRTLHAHQVINADASCVIVLCTRKDALLDGAAASVFRLTIAAARDLCNDRRWPGAEAVPEQVHH